MKPVYALVAAIAMLSAMAGSVWAQDVYRIRAGDVLRIEVLEDATLNRDALVLPDGRISLPLAGSVSAAGRSVEQVQASVTSLLAPNFAASPTVFVGLNKLVERRERVRTPKAPVTIDVYVLGEVANPGKREIEPGTTILQFFAEMGGFSKFAATKRVQLRTSRTGTEQVYVLNYNSIERGAKIGTTIIMSDGDVVVVPQRRLFE